MQEITKQYKKIERVLASMKFAVVIITIFAITLIYGTFQESYHGAAYAQKLVYKSFWFMGIQGLMLLSITFATIVRLPPRKALYGFYTIHAGLIILFIGSFVTYTIGIDGSIQLLPNSPSNKIIINEDLLKITFTEEKKAIAVPLPHSPFPSNIKINESKVPLKDKSLYKNIEFISYLPSAELRNSWEKSKGNQDPNDHSSEYQIFNDNVSQDFTLSLNPQADFRSTEKLGPLSIHYMPQTLFKCFNKESKSGFIMWDLQKNECFAIEEKGIKAEKTDKENRFFVYPYEGEYLKFFPDFSPLPVNDDLTKNADTPFRVFSRKLFESKPHLFLFGNKLSFYKKRKDKWIGKDFTQGPIIELPWMGFKLRLINHKVGFYPIQTPVYTKPIQDKGELIKGDIQAVQIAFMGEKYWIRSDAPLRLAKGDGSKGQLHFRLIQKEIRLPYQLTLEEFKMQTNPGTNTPASYESFISLLDGRNQNGLSKHHIFMNNPLKYDNFTFYQSSYFPMGQGQFGSVLSVNFDPGRPLKYLGSLLLVLGSIWHYIIRRKRKRKSNTSHSQTPVATAPLGEQNA